MDRLQFGWHHQLAAHDARLIGKALAIASLRAVRRSSFVNHTDNPLGLTAGRQARLVEAGAFIGPTLF